MRHCTLADIWSEPSTRETVIVRASFGVHVGGAGHSLFGTTALKSTQTLGAIVAMLCLVSQTDAERANRRASGGEAVVRVRKVQHLVVLLRRDALRSGDPI